jgi:AraC-like DNA-binding protein
MAAMEHIANGFDNPSSFIALFKCQFRATPGRFVGRDG